MTPSRTALALTLLLSGPALGQEHLAEDRAYLSDLPFPGSIPGDAEGRAAYVVTCVLDARSGEPIPGARLSLVYEATYPLSGMWWPSGTAESDEAGWVRLRVDELRRGPRPGAQPWLYVEAEGYAPYAHLGADLGASVLLEHGRDVEVWVRDALDRPVEGVQVGWMLGCGHTPDLRTARSDARGVALLPDIAPGAGELWPAARGFAADYGDLSGSSVALLRLAPGLPVHGRVLDRDGRPLEGVFVGASVRHRGPWARTDGEGRFEVLGLSQGESGALQWAGGSYGQLGSFALPPDGRELTLVVPLEPEPAVATVRVRARGAQGSEVPQDLGVAATRLADGFTELARRGEWGGPELELPAGSYVVRAGGGFTGYELVEAHLELLPSDLDAGGDADLRPPLELELQLEPSPRLRLDASGLLPGATVSLVGALEAIEVDPGELHAVPRTGPLGVAVQVEERVRASEIEPVRRTPGARIELEAPQPARLRFTLADSAGRPARGWALLPQGSEGLEEELERVREGQPLNEAFELATWRVGRLELLLIPEDPALAPRRVPLDLTPETAVLELGTLRFADARALVLTVLEPNGAPLSGARLEVRRDSGTRVLALDAEGRLTADTFELEPGDSLRVDSGDAPPFRLQLTGPGPWTVWRSTSSLSLEVLDEDGFGVPGFTLWIDGEVYETPASTATLPGLTPGLRRAVISAPGRLSMVLDFDLDHDEQRSIGFVLPRRP